jgi:hypothetical protein
MAITSGFFDSVNGDRTYDAEQMSNYFDGLVSDGVYENVGDRFLVTANSGMTVNVESGRAIIQCHWVKNDATTVLTLDPSDVQFGRIDAIVLQLDLENRTINLTTKKGTPSANPVMPAITRNETVYELYLATVLISKGATQPTSITDLRPSSYCGWVTGIVQQVDTSDLFLQWQNAYEQQFAAFDAYMDAKMQQFNAWFATLTGELTVETGITKYQNRGVASAGSYVVPILIDEYDIDEDVLLMFVDGVFFAEGYDYDVRPALPPPSYPYPSIKLTNGKTFTKDAEVTFVVLKNVVGKKVFTAGNTISQNFGSGVLSAGTTTLQEE